MSERQRFTDPEWQALAVGPTGAAGLVIAADPLHMVSMMKESYAAGKAVRAARKAEGWPPVVAELIGYQAEHKDELKGLTKSGETMTEARKISRHVLVAAGAAATKLSPEEFDGYLDWVLGIAREIAEASKELGSKHPISEAEAAVLVEIEALLRGTAPADATDPTT